MGRWLSLKEEDGFRTRARYGDRGAGLGEAVAEEGSAGGLSSTCRIIFSSSL